MDMNNIEGIIDEIMTVNGAIASSIIDWQSGMTLGSSALGDFDIELASAGNAEVIKAKMNTIDSLNAGSKIVDILITLTDEIHILSIVKEQPELCIYLVLDSKKANLALARHKIQSLV